MRNWPLWVLHSVSMSRPRRKSNGGPRKSDPGGQFASDERTTPILVWLKIRQEGQTAGFGPCFHFPGFHFSTVFFEPQPFELTLKRQPDMIEPFCGGWKSSSVQMVLSRRNQTPTSARVSFLCFIHSCSSVVSASQCLKCSVEPFFGSRDVSRTHIPEPGLSLLIWS